MGTELEVSQLIADHARRLKPTLVIETGTFHADTATLILRALNANAVEGFPAEFRTYEINPDTRDKAELALKSEGVHDGVKLHVKACTLQKDVSDLKRARVDLAFVDSAYTARLADIRVLAPLMAPLGLLFVHDARMEGMVSTMTRLREDPEWVVVEYPTPRGLALIQREVV